MKVGIIGSGFSGLSAAYYLSKAGVDVTVIEKDEKSGGLAIGFKEKGWDWTLEKHYHHWFVSDSAVLGLAKEIGQEVVFNRPKTSLLYNNQSFQLDSPLSLLGFPHLPMIDRLRTGATLFYLKYLANWKNLESITSERFLEKTMGEKSWQVLWEPLFTGKFHGYSKEIPASWFWARIKKRSARLGYPVGGFQSFADHISKLVHGNGGRIIFNKSVNSISKKGSKFLVKTDGDIREFDKVICTLPSTLFAQVTGGLPDDYNKRLASLKSIGALNLVLRLKKSFLKEGSYWLSINEKDTPFIAVVEHTNFMDKRNYGGEHILYVGNYLPHEHKYYKYTPKQLMGLFMPYLRKINPKFKKSQIIGSHLFPGKFAQPIIPLNYSQIIPQMKTPIEGLYLCNMQMVYPWDRGTNYAVELGEKVASMVIKS